MYRNVMYQKCQFSKRMNGVFFAYLVRMMHCASLTRHGVDGATLCNSLNLVALNSHRRSAQASSFFPVAVSLLKLWG